MRAAGTPQFYLGHDLMRINEMEGDDGQSVDTVNEQQFTAPTTAEEDCIAERAMNHLSIEDEFFAFIDCESAHMILSSEDLNDAPMCSSRLWGGNGRCHSSGY